MTAPGPALPGQPADLGKRLVARLIDAGIVLAPGLCLVGVAAALESSSGEPNAGFSVLGIAWYLGAFLYEFVMLGLSGQTVGKRVMKLKVVRVTGATPVVADALDPDQVAEAVGRADPDVIVHQLTSIGAIDLRHMDRDFARTNRLRTEGTDHLLSAGQAVGVKRFVAQSAIYGFYARTGGRVKTEEDRLDPDPPQGDGRGSHLLPLGVADGRAARRLVLGTERRAPRGAAARCIDGRGLPWHLRDQACSGRRPVRATAWRPAAGEAVGPVQTRSTVGRWNVRPIRSFVCPS